jgi:hypothetical protein
MVAHRINGIKEWFFQVNFGGGQKHRVSKNEATPWETKHCQAE